MTTIPFFIQRYKDCYPEIDQILDESGFRESHHVVDFGCKTGGWTYRLAEINGLVTGVDIREDFLEAARNEFRLQNSSTFESTFPAYTDAILCLGTLQVMTPDQVKEFFSDLGRKTFPTCRVLLSFPTLWFMVEKLIRKPNRIATMKHILFGFMPFLGPKDRQMAYIRKEDVFRWLDKLGFVATHFHCDAIDELETKVAGKSWFQKNHWILAER